MVHVGPGRVGLVWFGLVWFGLVSGRLFTAAQRPLLFCRKSKMSVDFHGNVVAQCTPSKSWSLNEHVKTLRGGGLETVLRQC